MNTFDPTALTSIANPNTEADQALIASIDELIKFQQGMVSQLIETKNLVDSGAFRFSTPVKRKELIDALASQADAIDDMSRAIIKGVRRVKRERLRDDEAIQALFHFWALNRSFYA